MDFGRLMPVQTAAGSPASLRDDCHIYLVYQQSPNVKSKRPGCLIPARVIGGMVYD